MDKSNGVFFWITSNPIWTKGHDGFPISRTRSIHLVSLDLYSLEKECLTISWSIFTEELQAQYSNSVIENFFSQLAKLQQIGSVKDYSQQFKNLSLRLDTIIEENLNDFFFSSLKDHIQHEVHMFCPGLVNESFILAHRV